MKVKKIEIKDITMNFFEFYCVISLDDGRVIPFLNRLLSDDWTTTIVPPLVKMRDKFNHEELMTLAYKLKPILDKKCKEYWAKRIEENNKNTKPFEFLEVEIDLENE